MFKFERRLCQKIALVSGMWYLNKVLFSYHNKVLNIIKMFFTFHIKLVYLTQILKPFLKIVLKFKILAKKIIWHTILHIFSDL